MSEKSARGNSDPDYQIGGFGEEITKDTSLGEESEFIEFDYETAAVFKRLADDIYESTEAGVREPLQNSITAVKRAVREAELNSKDGVIKIEVRDGEQVKMSLRDNGIGIKKSVLKEVLAVIGRSQNRDEGDLSGKYGMGFLACYKLVGVRGGFLMHTNSRETKEDPIKGIWKPGGFEIDTENKLPDQLSDDDYGTLFEFTLKQNVEIEQVRSWVKKHSEWSTVPIIYSEYDEDGKEVHNDEYGDKNLKEHYNNKKSLVIDNEYFTAVCSPKAKGNTLLINSPISRNGVNSVSKLRWKFDIRLKNENGVIIQGENEGLQPISVERYDSMDKKRKSKYIPKTELSDNEVCLPMPTGTRDTLESKKEFWEYLVEKFTEKYYDQLRSIVEQINDKSDYTDLTQHKQIILDDGLDRLSLLKKTNKQTKDKFEKEFGVDIDDSLINVLRISKKEVRLVQEGANSKKASRKNSSAVNKCSALYAEQNTDGDVFMAASLNQVKMDAVWDDKKENNVIQVHSAKDYDKFEDVFGWKKLKNVKKMLDELEVSDDIIEDLQGDRNSKTTSSSKKRNSERNLEERHLTVHQEGLNQSGLKVKEIKEKYNDGDKYLVLFPTSTEKKLSEHKNLESVNVGIANCIVKVSEYLEECSNVYTIDEWYDRIQNKDFKTNKGLMTIEEAKKDNNLILHLLGDDVIDMFRKDDIISEMETITRDSASHNSSYSARLSNFKSDNTAYIPVTPSELDQIRVCIDSKEDGVATLSGDINVYGSIGVSASPVDSDIYWYAWACLPRWRDTKEIDILSKKDWNLNPDWIWMIEKIASSDHDIKSITGLDIMPPEEIISFHTSNGYMSLRKIINRYDSAVLHILPMETVDAFRSEDVSQDTLDYITSNARSSGSFGSGELLEKDYFNKEDCVYVPVTKSECKEVEKILDNPVNKEYTLGESRKSCSIVRVQGEVRFRESNFAKFNIESDTVAYAYSRLPSKISDAAIPIKDHNSIDELSDGGLEFIETMAGIK
jgi:hypothetical protein